MCCNKKFPSSTLKSIDNCLESLEITENVLTCACCCYFLEKRKQKVVDEIIDSLEAIPDKITRIKVPLYPLPNNRFYYSFDGISTILYNLFKTENEEHKRSIENHQAFLKIYYEKNSLFNLPLIQIEALFFGELESKVIDEYWKTLKAEVLFFTNTVGEIDIIDVDGADHLQELFKIPLLFGYPEFKYEGPLKDCNFSMEQIKEMNYLHSTHLLQLDMSDVINNDAHELFSLQKEAIENEELRENINSSEFDNEDGVNAFGEYTRNYPYRLSEEDSNELPF